jgi:hypothetical protein
MRRESKAGRVTAASAAAPNTTGTKLKDDKAFQLLKIKWQNSFNR